MYVIDFSTDAADFLAAADPFLRSHPVTTTVVNTMADRAIRAEAAGVVRDPERPWWFAVVREVDHDGVDHGQGAVIGVAMRTAPGPRFPAWVNELPDEAARLLARTLYERGERLGGVNGALPAARIVAEESARLWSTGADLAEHTRLFELDRLRPPQPVPGRLDPARPEEVELIHRWRSVFHAEAAEQSGRPDSDGGFEVNLADTRTKIDAGELWCWRVDGEPVHLSGASLPSFGVSRIGPVYTPKEHRGRGYAGAAVAELSRRLQEQGVRVCLFTDQANPVSNQLYQRLGYRPVVDMAQFVINPESARDDRA